MPFASLTAPLVDAPPQAQALDYINAGWREQVMAANKWQPLCGKVFAHDHGPYYPGLHGCPLQGGAIQRLVAVREGGAGVIPSGYPYGFHNPIGYDDPRERKAASAGRR